MKKSFLLLAIMVGMLAIGCSKEQPDGNEGYLPDTNNTFNIPAEGGIAIISYKTSVDCDVIIPEYAQDWITIAPATRGLVTYNTTLNIAANNTGKERSSVVKVISQGHNEIFAEYTIIQNPRYCLCYTSVDGRIVEPYRSSSFNATILSNTYKDGVGEIEFDVPITMIGKTAFYGCTRLTSVTIPDSVISIELNAFCACSSLTCVTIPDSVTKIGDGAFFGCTSLTSVIIPDSVTSIAGSAFSSSGLTSVTIPDSVTKIGVAAFQGCSNLTSVTIGDSVTSIGYAAFYGCSCLTSITIPDSVTSIDKNAFLDCSGLTSVTIGDSVTSIGPEVFLHCNSLTSVYCKPTTPPVALRGTGNWEAFNDNASGRKIYVPTESVSKYKSASYWSNYADAIVGYNF